MVHHLDFSVLLTCRDRHGGCSVGKARNESQRNPIDCLEVHVNGLTVDHHRVDRVRIHLQQRIAAGHHIRSGRYHIDL